YEIQEVWGGSQFPWGNNFLPDPYPPASGGKITDFTTTVNWFNATLLFYHYPDFGDSSDEAGYISAPGRFPLDKTTILSPNGEAWMDIAANMMETTEFTTDRGFYNFCDYSIFRPDLGDFKDPACNYTNPQTGISYQGVLRARSLPTSGW